MDWRNQLRFSNNPPILRQYVEKRNGSAKILLPEHRVETFAKPERKTRHEPEGLF